MCSGSASGSGSGSGVEVQVVAVVEVVVTVGYEDTLECLLFLEVYVNGDCNIELS